MFIHRYDQVSPAQPVDHQAIPVQFIRPPLGGRIAAELPAPPLRHRGR